MSAARSMSALAHFADSTRTSPYVREVPGADICAATQSALCRVWVKTRRIRIEHIESALPPLATEERTFGNGSSVPTAIIAAVRLTGFMEYPASHSGSMLAARITLPHFSVSSAMSLPKSAGVIGIGTPPRSAKRAFILGSARPSLICLFS
jgi:hypothetical protein